MGGTGSGRKNPAAGATAPDHTRRSTAMVRSTARRRSGPVGTGRPSASCSIVYGGPGPGAGAQPQQEPAAADVLERRRHDREGSRDPGWPR